MEVKRKDHHVERPKKQNQQNKINDSEEETVGHEIGNKMDKITLTLAGGGFKGLLFIPILQGIEDTKVEIVTYSGTSVGSLVGLIHSLGYKAQEIEDILVITGILDKSFDINYSLLATNFSIINIEPLISLIRNMLENIHKIKTMKEHYDRTKKTLIMCATNLATKQTQYFSRIHTPEQNIIEALLSSINLPFIFSSTTFNGEQFNQCIDGFFSDNCPFEILLNDKNTYDNTVIIKHVVCNFLDIPTNETIEEGIPIIEDLSQYILRIIEVIMDQILLLNNYKILHQTKYNDKVQLINIKVPLGFNYKFIQGKDRTAQMLNLIEKSKQDITIGLLQFKTIANRRYKLKVD